MTPDQAFERYVLPELDVLLRAAMSLTRNAEVNRVRRRRPELLRDPEAGDRLLESQDPHDSAEQDALRDAVDLDGPVLSRLHRARHRIKDRLGEAGLLGRGPE